MPSSELSSINLKVLQVIFCILQWRPGSVQLPHQPLKRATQDDGVRLVCVFVDDSVSRVRGNASVNEGEMRSSLSTFQNCAALILSYSRLLCKFYNRIGLLIDLLLLCVWINFNFFCFQSHASRNPMDFYWIFANVPFRVWPRVSATDYKQIFMRQC